MPAIAQALYGKDKSYLTAQEKQNIVDIISMGKVAVSLASGASGEQAYANVTIAKYAVDNNLMWATFDLPPNFST